MVVNFYLKKGYEMSNRSKSTDEASIFAYFSHSYRPKDIKLNQFFWKLFCKHGIYFTVDPESKFISIPYLEFMMHKTNCFIAVVDYRSEIDYFKCSPYILFEYGLAIQAEKPLLVFLDSRVNDEYFQNSKTKIVRFDIHNYNSRTEEFYQHIKELKEKVQGYRGYSATIKKNLGIIIDSEQGANEIYTEARIKAIVNEFRKAGFQVGMIDLAFDESYKFCLHLDDYNLLLLDVNETYLPPWIAGFIFGRFIPSLKLCNLKEGETKESMSFTPLFSNYGKIISHIEEEENIIYWTDFDKLMTKLRNHLKKFDQEENEKNVFKKVEEGDRYFHSLGRRKERIFLSNADSKNYLATALSKYFDDNYFDHFHYKHKNPIRNEDDIPTGADWQQVLEHELQNCKIFVAFIDNEYFAKKWCSWEINEAIKNKDMKYFLYNFSSNKEVPTVLPEKLKKIHIPPLKGLTEKKIIEKISNDLDYFLKKEEI